MVAQSFAADHRVARATQLVRGRQDAIALQETDRGTNHLQKFLRAHTDASGRVRADLWEEGVKRAQQMEAVAAPADSTGAAGGVTEGFAGTEWVQIGPSPLRMIQPLDYFFGKGPISGLVSDIAIDPRGATDQVIYLATSYGGVWKSTNGGASWNPKTDFLPSPTIGAVALDPGNPSIVYAGTGNYFEKGAGFTKGVGIYRSTDGGDTWLVLNPYYVFTNIAINRIVLPSPNVLLVATTSGLYRSIDGGLHFGSNAPAFDNALPSLNGFVTDLELDTAAANTVYASVEKVGVLRSTDGGVTFPTNLFNNPGAPAPPFRFIAMAQSKQPNNQRMYASVQSAKGGFGDFAGLFRSDDGGAHWMKMAAADEKGADCQCGYDQTIGVDPQDANRLYLGFQRLWRSLDGGGSFNSVTTSDVQIHVDHHALAFTPATHGGGAAPTRLYVGTDGGISRTDDGGLNWANPNESLATILFYGIDIGRGNAFNQGFTYGATQDNGTPVRRPDMPGTDWYGGADTGDGTVVAVDPCNPWHAVAVDNSTYYIVTTDGGASWTQKKWNYSGNNVLYFIDQLAFDPNCNAIYAQGGSTTGPFTLFRSTDGGDTFVPMRPGLGFSAMATVFSNPNVLWLGHNGGTVERTSNAMDGAGSTWTSLPVTGAPTQQPVSGIAINPTNINDVVVVYPGFCGNACAPGKRTKHVFRTTDDGVSWTDISGTDGGEPTTNLPDLPLHAVVIWTDPYGVLPDTIIVASDTGVMQSSDHGATWHVMGTGLPTVFSTSLALDPAVPFPVLRVGTYGRGAFELRPAAGSSPCETATTIPAAGGVFSGTTFGRSTIASACNAGKADAPEQVFQWTPDATGTAFIGTCSQGTDFDTLLSVRGVGCRQGAERSCNDNACQGASGAQNASWLALPVTAGETYFIVVDGFDGDSGHFGLSVTPPEAACAAATVIPAGGGYFTGTTEGYDTIQGECGGAGPERVFQWTPDTTGTAVIDTCAGATYDTLLYMRKGNCHTGPEVACNHYAFCPTGLVASRIFPSVIAGETYYIIVDGAGGDSGDFTLQVVPPATLATPTPTSTPTATETTPPTHLPTPTVTETPPAPSPPPKEQSFAGAVYLQQAGSAVRGAQVHLYGSMNPSDVGQPLATTRTAVDGAFMFSLLTDPQQEFTYYFLVLDDPDYTAVQVAPGPGGESVGGTRIRFTNPPAGDRSGNLFYADKSHPGPPHVPLTNLVPAWSGSFVPFGGGSPQDPGGSPMDLSILGIELSQATQCFDQSQGYTACKDNSVELSAGKAIAVRVYINHQGGPTSQCTSGSAAFLKGVRVGLTWSAYPPCAQQPCGYGFWAGPGAPQYFDVPCSTSINELRAGAWGSATFYIPADATVGMNSLALHATVNSDTPIWKESNYNNNAYDLKFYPLYARQPLNVRWALIDYKPAKAGSWQYTGNPLADANVVGARSGFMSKIYPMAVNYSQLPTVAYTGPDARSDDATKVLNTLVSAYNSPGMNPKPDALVGWLPFDALGGGYKPSNQGCGGASVFQSAVVAQCAQPTWMESILAHETGHTRGLDHPHEGKELCWPFPNDRVIAEATTREIGFDLVTKIPVAGTAYDLMDQASNYWISPYTWSRLIPLPYSSQWAKVGPGCAGAGAGSGSAIADQAKPEANAPQPAIIITGSVQSGGSADFGAFYELATSGPFPDSDPAGAYCLSFDDAGGSGLASHCFNLSFQSAETGDVLPWASFSFVLPLPLETARVVLRHGNIVLAERQASAHAPAVSVLTPSAGATVSGATTLSWTASDADGDALRFLVSYSPDNGGAWLPIGIDVEGTSLGVDATSWPGSDNGLLRVMASDGFHSTAALSAPFRVPSKSPRVGIYTPGPGTRITPYDALVLEGYADDLEDGTLTGDHLAWTDDRQGVIGNGAQLIVPGLGLVTGQHTITLTATDSDGHSSTAGVVVTVADCAGDCNMDAVVTVDEVLTMVNVAVAAASLGRCQPGDRNGDGSITVDEILTAVKIALNGCS